MKPDIVITGMGVVSPIGSSVEDFWTALVTGKSGVRAIDRYDTSAQSSTIAAPVEDDDFMSRVPRRVSRRVDRVVSMALAAGAEAVAASGVAEIVQPARFGVCVGTSAGPFETNAFSSELLVRGDFNGFRRRFPYLSTSGSFGGIAAEIAREHGAHGPSLTVSAECSSGVNAIGLAMMQLRAGLADVILAGGADATVNLFAHSTMNVVGALSTRNHEPTAACRPFDEERDGFVLGEGSGMLVLETRAHAVARGAKIIATVAGYGAATDTVHPTAPDPEGRGAVASINAALDDAGIERRDVALINAHATGTRLNDPIELKAIRDVFGAHAEQIAIYGTKPLTGHMIAAAGAVEAIALVLSLSHSLVPATANCENLIDTRMDIVRASNREMKAGVGLTLSFGFGGQCAALVIVPEPGAV